ncbi:MAG: NAD-dependent dihydropyrimidine dehydrogenase subunit PreA [Deltaproteobacteria bacterium]|nr:NAD-dependent dihydropyrimidine dehydrogenase subunit PreA [Deltaproteobacteria bacterium]
MTKPSLEVVANGMKFKNPFVLGSGPPGTNGKVISRAFERGWGGCVAKTISLDSSKVINVAPRYGKHRSRENGEVIGFENIELISDRPFEVWLDEFKQVKKQHPDHVLIASIMEEYDKKAWQTIVKAVQETGVDGFELNLSCPHGLPERRMGAAMGQAPEITREVVGWVKEVSRIPVWAKMTPNVTDITLPARAAVEAGADGIAAINTILSVIQVDLDSMRPAPNVLGHTVPGGYSGQAVRPIALRQVMELARCFADRPEISISGIGGIEKATDALQFMALGATTTQICTGAMLLGFEMVDDLIADMAKWMSDKGYSSPSQFIGKALDAFTTHQHLTELQREAKIARAGERSRDNDWNADKIKEQTAALTST